MNSEQMTKTMENFIHYVLINNLKQLCEQIISDNDFPKMYNYTTELNTLNTLRKEFTICYRTIMSKTKNDFSNCELTDFKFLCYLGLKVTSQLIKIDRSLQNINLKRKLKICDLSEMLFIKTYHLLRKLNCPLNQQEYQYLMTERLNFVGKKMVDIVENKVLKSIKSGNPSEWHSMVYKINSETGEEDIIDID